MKNLSTTAKALIMGLVTIIASTISTHGFPTTTDGWEIMGITLLGTVLAYLAQTAALPSVSLFGTIDLKDVLKGLLMGIGTGLSNWAATAIVGEPINWNALITLIFSVISGYFIKNFASQPPK